MLPRRSQLVLPLLLLLALLQLSPSSAADAPPSSSPNLVSNPGFEASHTELTDWSGTSHADASGDARTGAVCARLGDDANSTATTSLSQRFVSSPNSSSDPHGSRCYAVEFWAKESPSYDPADNRLEADLYIDGHAIPLEHNQGSTTQLPIKNGALDPPANSWRHFYFYECTPPPLANSSIPTAGGGGVQKLRLKWRGNGYLIDDVSVSVQTCPDASEFESFLRDLLVEYRLPSIAVASVRQGVTICAAAVGSRVWNATDMPVSLSDRYHIGSDTKGMTAIVAGMAVEAGLLGWDTRVTDVFPDVEMTEEFKLINLTQLLSHSSGIGQAGDRAVFGELVPQLDCGDTERNLPPMRHEVLRFLAMRNLSNTPGTQWDYSNAGYMVAGHMAEHVFDVPYERLITERLFDGLHLTSAGLGCQVALGRVNAAIAHKRHANGTIEPFYAGPHCDNPAVLGPAGIAHMSVLDFAYWAGWSAGQGKRGPHIVSPATIIRTHTGIIEANPPNPPPGTPPPGMYAMGWGMRAIEWAPVPLLYHAGSNNKNLVNIWAEPKADFAMVTMTNVGGVEAEDALLKAAQKMYTTLAPKPA